MGGTDKTSATISIDLRRYGIRLHRSALRNLGDPKYIQLLVNPVDGIVAIRTAERSLSGDQVHRIIEKRWQSDSGYEIYSKSFVLKLSDIAGGLDDGYSYRLQGQTIPAEKIAVFPLRTLQKVEK